MGELLTVISSHKTEVAFMIATLMAGIKRRPVQDFLTSAGALPILARAMCSTNWLYDPGSSPPPRLHGPTCECRPETAKTIQTMRLLYTMLDRDAESPVQRWLSRRRFMTEGELAWVFTHYSARPASCGSAQLAPWEFDMSDYAARLPWLRRCMPARLFAASAAPAVTDASVTTDGRRAADKRTMADAGSAATAPDSPLDDPADESSVLVDGLRLGACRPSGWIAATIDGAAAVREALAAVESQSGRVPVALLPPSRVTADAAGAMLHVWRATQAGPALQRRLLPLVAPQRAEALGSDAALTTRALSFGSESGTLTAAAEVRPIGEGGSLAAATEALPRIGLHICDPVLVGRNAAGLRAFDVNDIDDDHEEDDSSWGAVRTWGAASLHPPQYGSATAHVSAAAPSPSRGADGRPGPSASPPPSTVRVLPRPDPALTIDAVCRSATAGEDALQALALAMSTQDAGPWARELAPRPRGVVSLLLHALVLCTPRAPFRGWLCSCVETFLRHAPEPARRWACAHGLVRFLTRSLLSEYAFPDIKAAHGLADHPSDPDALAAAARRAKAQERERAAAAREARALGRRVLTDEPAGAAGAGGAAGAAAGGLRVLPQLAAGAGAGAGAGARRGANDTDSDSTDDDEEQDEEESAVEEEDGNEEEDDEDEEDEEAGGDTCGGGDDEEEVTSKLSLQSLFDVLGECVRRNPAALGELILFDGEWTVATVPGLGARKAAAAAAASVAEAAGAEGEAAVDGGALHAMVDEAGGSATGSAASAAAFAGAEPAFPPRAFSTSPTSPLPAQTSLAADPNPEGFAWCDAFAAPQRAPKPDAAAAFDDAAVGAAAKAPPAVAGARDVASVPPPSTHGTGGSTATLAAAGVALQATTLFRLACDRLQDANVFLRALMRCEDWAFGVCGASAAVGGCQLPQQQMPQQSQLQHVRPARQLPGDAAGSLYSERQAHPWSWEQLAAHSQHMLRDRMVSRAAAAAAAACVHVTGGSGRPPIAALLPPTAVGAATRLSAPLPRPAAWYSAVDEGTLTAPSIAHLTQFRIPLVWGLISAVSVRTLTQETLCCINTGIMPFVMAHRHGALPALVAELKAHAAWLAAQEARYTASQQSQRAAATAPPTPSARGKLPAAAGSSASEAAGSMHRGASCSVPAVDAAGLPRRLPSLSDALLFAQPQRTTTTGAEGAGAGAGAGDDAAATTLPTSAVTMAAFPSSAAAAGVGAGAGAPTPPQGSQLPARAILRNWRATLQWWLEYYSTRERDRRLIRLSSGYSYEEYRAVARALLGLHPDLPATRPRQFLSGANSVSGATLAAQHPLFPSAAQPLPPRTAAALSAQLDAEAQYHEALLQAWLHDVPGAAEAAAGAASTALSTAAGAAVNANGRATESLSRPTSEPAAAITTWEAASEYWRLCRLGCQ
jgi:hypothetical protein